MLYAIMAIDGPDGAAKRPTTRPKHLEYIQPLADEGRVLLAGPHPAIDSVDPGPAGMTGSLIVAEFESLTAAKAWVAEDPYWLEGVFESVDIKPFVKVLP